MACISMEYVDGETLSNLRAEKDQRVFEPSELAAWMLSFVRRSITRTIMPASSIVI